MTPSLTVPPVTSPCAVTDDFLSTCKLTSIFINIKESTLRRSTYQNHQPSNTTLCLSAGTSLLEYPLPSKHHHLLLKHETDQPCLKLH